LVRAKIRSLSVRSVSSGPAAFLQNVASDISNGTPSPLPHRILKRSAWRSIMCSAGEPPGHTHRPFCRDGSPKVLERSGQNVFWSPSALRRYATQRTHTKRNNATRTQRRDANTLAGTAEGRQLGNRSRRTQLQRHEQLPRRLERPHPALCSANEARIAVTFRQREGMILST
jgi:hypothetical protein